MRAPGSVTEPQARTSPAKLRNKPDLVSGFFMAAMEAHIAGLYST
jgi:hypothetical protein